MTRFYLGTHQPHWLAISPVPLMVSVPRLAAYRARGDHPRAPSARVSWALDSGGFTQVTHRGGWPPDHQPYASLVARLVDETGWPPDFAAPQDWMCEVPALAATGLSIADHQELTTANYLALVDEVGWVPWLPVLQGWWADDYLAHLEAYAAAGVDLTAAPLVGVGSICREQNSRRVDQIVHQLWARGLALHGFGVKTDGLARYGHLLASADSLAWSSTARWERYRRPGCDHPGTCGNCLAWALEWRDQVLAKLDDPQQGRLAL